MRAVSVRLGLAVATASAALCLPASVRSQTQQTTPPGTAYDTVFLRTLDWRSVGPSIGGRSTTAVGVPGDTLLYYMGTTGGGLWKTENGGQSWFNISDGFFTTGSIGDIAVYPGNSSILYVGTGEAPVRGQMSPYGDGVYKSTDAGETWTHVGLEDTRQISRVIVDPTDPDLVYVAAQGSRWAPTEERGVYRTTDGGASWTRVLFVSPGAGVSDLVMDPLSPEVLYAAFWDFQRLPWKIESGGPGSGIWKSVDGGDTWAHLENGLPSVMGRICLAMSAAESSRIYANVEADTSGMYRSEDGGASWQRVSTHPALGSRPWYFCEITADPKDADILYMMGFELLKSTDAGVSYSVLPSTHSDEHRLWINPSRSRNMILANDGGAAVSFDAGTTWSPVDNQTTGQFYGVQADHLFPYNLYGGQQDAGTVVIPSRTLGGRGRGRTNGRSVGGGESARFAFDPEDPRIVLATGFLGQVQRTDVETGIQRNVAVWPGQHFGLAADKMTYRFNWSAPLAWSPFDPSVIYYGGNALFRTTDQGTTWTAISPDLTRNDKSRQGRSGPFWHDGSGGEVYNTIVTITPTQHEVGTIWVGTDDGLIQLTRDEGLTWTNVTPKGLPEGLVLSIDESPHAPGTAYVAFSRLKWNDNTPHFFKTTDYGETWTDLAGPLPQNAPARVIREDPRRRGLLYAATEYGVWISFHDGASWQSLQRNLPVVPVSDLKVHEDDLLAATEGRAFWILDDLTALQQLHEDVVRADLFLFEPRAAYRTAGARPEGARIRYSLAAPPEAKDTLRLEILDASGVMVRRYAELTASRGVNQLLWDLRGEPVPGAGVNGPLLPSGRYTVRITLGRTSVSRPIDVLPDPRTSDTPLTGQDHAILARSLMESTAELKGLLTDVRDVRDQALDLAERAKTSDAPALDLALHSLTAKLDSVIAELSPPIDMREGSLQVLNLGLGLSGELSYLLNAVDGGSGPLTQGERDRASEIQEELARVGAVAERALTEDVERVNALASNAGLGPGIVRRGAVPRRISAADAHSPTYP